MSLRQVQSFPVGDVTFSERFKLPGSLATAATGKLRALQSDIDGGGSAAGHLLCATSGGEANPDSCDCTIYVHLLHSGLHNSVLENRMRHLVVWRQTETQSRSACTPVLLRPVADLRLNAIATNELVRWLCAYMSGIES